LGTGELSDSLALDSVFPISPILISFFAQRDHAVLELKTKSAEVDHLPHLDHRKRTIISWSLNPPEIIEGEEMGTWVFTSITLILGFTNFCYAEASKNEDNIYLSLPDFSMVSSRG
jgi:hypothetical protein